MTYWLAGATALTRRITFNVFETTGSCRATMNNPYRKDS